MFYYGYTLANDKAQMMINHDKDINYIKEDGTFNFNEYMTNNKTLLWANGLLGEKNNKTDSGIIHNRVVVSSALLACLG